MRLSNEEMMDNSKSSSETLVWVSVALFALVVALLGGAVLATMRRRSPHFGQWSLCFLVPAFYYLRASQLKDYAAPLWLLLAIAGWMAAQLIPLPPGAWQNFPARDMVASIDQLAGLGDIWRPISLDPGRGWNALASLIVPLTALLLALALRARPRQLLLVIAAVGLANALLGLLQEIGGSSSPLYLYTLTNRGAPVGLFANENHAAVFAAIALLAIARLASSSKQSGDPSWLRFVFAPAFMVVLFAILVSGSRAGFAMSVIALIVGAFMIWSSLSARRRRNRNRSLEAWLSSHPRVLLLALLAIVAGLVAVFSGLERAPGLEGVLARNPFEDLRWRLWPVLEDMVGIYWKAGVGFGAFEEAYHIHEPVELLLPNYLNQAHNDWAQLIIEGGIIALIILLAALVWIGSLLRAILVREGQSIADVAFWGSVISILCVASLFDYPLRTPIFQLAATWLVLCIKMESKDQAFAC